MFGKSFASVIKLKYCGLIVTNIGGNYICCQGNVYNTRQAVYV